MAVMSVCCSMESLAEDGGSSEAWLVGEGRDAWSGLICLWNAFHRRGQWLLHISSPCTHAWLAAANRLYRSVESPAPLFFLGFALFELGCSFELGHCGCCMTWHGEVETFERGGHVYHSHCCACLPVAHCHVDLTWMD